MDGLVPGLGCLGYVLDQAHWLLAEDVHRPHGPNIGRHGENLTISFLSCERAELSLRLLDSIVRRVPEFGGEVLVVDNGSGPDELERVRQACAAMPMRARVVALGANYGVAGGRNRGMAHVATDWVMCLDNDMYFLFDQLVHVQRDLAMLGAHFLNLPLLDERGQRLFARGGHLYVGARDGAVVVGAGSACAQIHYEGGVQPAFFSTFLFGGASVLNRETFLRLGGYDEGMFVGFEDIDFSIRLFRAGMKVGTCSAVALVHDHAPPASDSDLAYERERFSRAVLRRSADHFEAKHGIQAWNDGVDRWLAERHASMGLDAKDPPALPESSPPESGVAAVADVVLGPSRPRIALVVDVDGWAFWNIAQQLERHLSDRYAFTVISSASLDNLAQALILARSSDIIHVFWREYLRMAVAHGAPRAYLEGLGGDWDAFLRDHVRSRVISTAVYDHLFLDAEAVAERAAFFRTFVNGYYVSSRRLDRIYRTLSYPSPLAVLEDGVDLSVFRPQNPSRFDCFAAEEVRVGWVGNSRWGAWHAGGADLKGLHTILDPAIDQLRAEGLPLRRVYADSARERIPHEAMADYYAGIDVLVCASAIEGTPNPVLEAMACGVPVVSTDVGWCRTSSGPHSARSSSPSGRSVPWRTRFGASSSVRPGSPSCPGRTRRPSRPGTGESRRRGLAATSTICWPGVPISRLGDHLGDDVGRRPARSTLASLRASFRAAMRSRLRPSR